MELAWVVLMLLTNDPSGEKQSLGWAPCSEFPPVTRLGHMRLPAVFAEKQVNTLSSCGDGRTCAFWVQDNGNTQCAFRGWYGGLLGTVIALSFLMAMAMSSDECPGMSAAAMLLTSDEGQAIHSIKGLASRNIALPGSAC